MATDYTKSKVGIKKSRIRLYLRPTAAYTAPTSLAERTALLATAKEVGELDDKTLKLEVAPNETRALNDGQNHVLDFKGTLDATDPNMTPANAAHVEATWDNQDVDAILDDEANKILRVVKDINLQVTETVLSGDVSTMKYHNEKINLNSKSEYREVTDYSAFV
jgi:hypothetical protein